MARAPDDLQGKGPPDADDPRWGELFASTELQERLRRHATSRAIALELGVLRREAGLGLRELARSAGWDPAFVSRLEAGRGLIPTPATIARFARACGAEVGYSLRREGIRQTVWFGPDVQEPIAVLAVTSPTASSNAPAAIPKAPSRRRAAAKSEP